MIRFFLCIALSLGCGWLAGCKREHAVEFEPNRVYTHATEIRSGYSMNQALAETQTALERFFGTPDDPKLPDVLLEEEEFAKLVSMENVRKASGSLQEEGRGYYRAYCATCHGVTGNGRGTTAALIDPYPRDYRAGIFKYKSTERGAKPTDADLRYIIRNGVGGTAMTDMRELIGQEDIPEEEIDEIVDALVDYVKYLSIRGEFERAMITEGEYVEFEPEEEGQPGEHLFDESSADFDFQLEIAQEFLTDIAMSWVRAEDRVVEIPEPGDVPVPATIESLISELEEGNAELRESVAKGKEIFLSETAACAKCHGKEGRGDGQNTDYDDWTKEWTTRIGVDPTDRDEQIPLLARGALPPRIIIPRDFRAGVFRGGAEPERLYHRISQGIEGTPMPAANLPPDDIWHLINFVRSLVDLEEEKPTTESPEVSESVVIRATSASATPANATRG